MDFKETKNSTTSVKIEVPKTSKKRDSDNHEVYDILFPSKEDEALQNSENRSSHKGHEKPKFGGVSTLDWLSTWRSLEIS